VWTVVLRRYAARHWANDSRYFEPPSQDFGSAGVIWEPAQLVKAMEALIWRNLPESAPVWETRLLRLLRVIVVLIRDIAYGQLTLRAMSLVYTTLLSIVPLLALSFSVLKAFGVHNQIAPMLHRFLAPLGPKGEEISHQIVEFIDRMNVGVLGSLGLALLLYTAISLMQKIEESFNYIWHISQPRSLAERFSRYLSVLLVGPILLFAAIGLTATAMNIGIVRDVLTLEPLGQLVYEVGRLMPYVLVVGAFTFIYIFIPNTSVGFGPALVGGIAGGVLWQSAGMGFAMFVASSTKYSAIYSGFAILILFMIWLYLSWLILLFGASVAFYQQHPEYLVAESGEPHLSNRMRERLALAIMSLIGGHYVTGRPAWSMRQLTQTLGVPMHSVQVVLGALAQANLLVESNDEPPAYLPARDLGAIPVPQLLEAVRRAGEDRFLNPAALPVSEPVAQVLSRIEHALSAATVNVTVKDLASDPLAKVAHNRVDNGASGAQREAEVTPKPGI
jgi:membrane protein